MSKNKSGGKGKNKSRGKRKATLQNLQRGVGQSITHPPASRMISKRMRESLMGNRLILNLNPLILPRAISPNKMLKPHLMMLRTKSRIRQILGATRMASA